MDSAALSRRGWRSHRINFTLRWVARRACPCAWLEQQRPNLGATCLNLSDTLRSPFFPAGRLQPEDEAWIGKLTAVQQRQSADIEQHNEAFVLAEVQAHKEFFDQVEKTPLTMEQRRAAIIMEDRNLLIAAAGSGKTSTIVGKVGYALLRGYPACNYRKPLTERGSRS